MAKANEGTEKKKRVVKPAGPRPVFILIEVLEGQSADVIKNAIKGFSLDVNQVLDQVEQSGGRVAFKRIMIPRSARKRSDKSADAA